jgi:putative oxidoreductase
MPELIGRFAPQAFAIFRLVTGLLFACHGSQKLFGWPPGDHGGGPLPPLITLAAMIELVGGLLIAIGFFTRIVAILTCGEMAAAYFMAHAPHGPIPIVNKGELAVLYCFAFLYIAAHGGGIWSVDNVLRRRSTVTGSTAARPA